MNTSPLNNRLLHAAILLTAIFPVIAGGTAIPYPSDGGLAAKIAPFVDNNVIPGAVLLVADKEKILDLETVGYSDLEKKTPMNPNALFMVCSMTKTLTSVAMMMLVDEGKVSLDDPVEKYLPAFKGQMVKDGKTPLHLPKHPITIREIMSHTAGLHKGHEKQDPTSLVANASIMGKLPLDWEPGTNYVYSSGPMVGGAIIQVVSGMPYADFVQQRILDPLGMKETTFWPSPELSERLALTGKYNPETKKLENLKHTDDVAKRPDAGAVPPRVLSQASGEVVQAYKYHFAGPAGGIYSTALDWTRFAQMLLSGGTYEGRQYISAAAFKEMTTLQTGKFFPGNSEGYGLGFFLQKNPSADGPAPGSFGHLGARKTNFWVDPTNDLVMIMMTQAADLKHEDQSALYGAFFRNAIAKYGKAGKGSASSN